MASDRLGPKTFSSWALSTRDWDCHNSCELATQLHLGLKGQNVPMAFQQQAKVKNKPWLLPGEDPEGQIS